MPEYTVHLEDIMVKFTPLGHQDIIKDQNVLINDPLNVLLDGSLEKIVLSAIKGNSHITQAQLATNLNRSDRQIRRVIKETGVLVTYCSAQPVRKAMDISGFKLGKAENEKGHSFATVVALDEAFIKTPLDDYELGLLNTKAAIPYRDKDLSASAGEMFKTREKEVRNSALEGASAYIRRMKGKP